MLIKLNWITLRVSNLEASLGFYHDMLGLQFSADSKAVDGRLQCSAWRMKPSWN